MLEKFLHGVLREPGHASGSQPFERLVDLGPRRRLGLCVLPIGQKGLASASRRVDCVVDRARAVLLLLVPGGLGLAPLDRLLDGGGDFSIGDELTLQKMELPRCPPQGMNVEALSAVLS